MTDNEKQLATGLLALLRTVKMQQITISGLMLNDAAVRETLKTDASLQIELEKQMDIQRRSLNSQILAATIEKIDATISLLEKNFGPWKN